ncbi:MAG: 5-oxoprolinase [Myxococcales bacterium]|nr:5-oxoprolinase [Myxococcales bacterium]|tara:strand:+ start:989 stop:2563 length:1575 start_codon:yes stop_codon:yes gene_type:complete
MSEATDGIAITLYQNRFRQVAEEMGETIKRSAFSANIKEREDHSCALFNHAGEMIAQAAHIPVHLGAMPATLNAVRARIKDFAPGDVVIVNDPYAGGTHLPDITLVSPFFHEKELAFFLVSRAHHSDVGGMTPGSMPLSTEVFQEGLILPPVKLFEEGQRNEALFQVILKNTRTPHERQGDLNAQLAAHEIGGTRLKQLIAADGYPQLKRMAKVLLDYAEEKVGAALSAWPKGEATFSDNITIPGTSKSAAIHCHLCIDASGIVVDFTGTDDQVMGPINAVKSIVDSAVFYVCRTLWPASIPHNGGAHRPVQIKTRQGSLLDARSPAGVVGGNVETSQRIVDVLYGAFAQLLPEKVPAASQGTMNNLTIGGLDHDGNPYTYYETIGGGHGAHALGEGLSGRQSHMTNTRNTPIEALEQAYPFWIETYALRENSGGMGKYQGGDGLARTYVFEKEAFVTLFSSRRRQAPYGLTGGAPGQVGNQSKVNSKGETEPLPDSFTLTFFPGEKLQIQTPGGGGFGTEESP